MNKSSCPYQQLGEVRSTDTYSQPRSTTSSSLCYSTPTSRYFELVTSCCSPRSWLLWLSFDRLRWLSFQWLGGCWFSGSRSCRSWFLWLSSFNRLRCLSFDIRCLSLRSSAIDRLQRLSYQWLQCCSCSSGSSGCRSINSGGYRSTSVAAVVAVVPMDKRLRWLQASGDQLQWLLFRSTPVAVVRSTPVAVVPVLLIGSLTSFQRLQWPSFDRLQWWLSFQCCRSAR